MEIGLKQNYFQSKNITCNEGFIIRIPLTTLLAEDEVENKIHQSLIYLGNYGQLDTFSTLYAQSIKILNLLWNKIKIIK